MAEELKNLIEKIQEEGVRAAEEKARGIENQAQQEAKGIIENARREAEAIIADAKEKAAKETEAGRLALKQAARDIIISLRKEIIATLDKVIASAVKDALGPAELVKILNALIVEQGQKSHKEIVITLSKEDYQKVEKGFIGSLTQELKKGIALRASEDVYAGFLISFDAGLSHFDFTDQALTDYLSAYVKPKLTEILK